MNTVKRFLGIIWMLTGIAAIALLIIGVNLLSDGMRRVFRYEGQIE